MYCLEVINRMNEKRSKLEDNNLSRRDIDAIEQQINDYKERVRNESK